MKKEGRKAKRGVREMEREGKDGRRKDWVRQVMEIREASQPGLL